MRVASGKVVGNTVVVEGEPLPEGRHVLVYLEDHADGWALDESSTQELREAIAEADKGDFVSPEEFWASVPPLGK